jgi:hypothetical protein
MDIKTKLTVLTKRDSQNLKKDATSTKVVDIHMEKYSLDQMTSINKKDEHSIDCGDRIVKYDCCYN